MFRSNIPLMADVNKWAPGLTLLLLVFAAACSTGQATLSEEVPPRRGEAEVLGEVQDITAEVLGIPFADVAEEADFRDDLGATDEQMAEIATIFEEAFGVALTDDEVRDLTTVRAAAELIASKR